jgi:UDP-GlcNAc:undecaprenyl-phosphate GlcNAc-1-phosphate transferase
MLIGGRTPDVSGQTYFFFAPLFIPVFILGVPIADMAFAFIRRTAKGTGFHTRDMNHVHHRLLRLGHGPRRTVAILWAWTAVLSAFLLYPLFDKQGNAVIPFGVIVLGLALYTLFHPGLRKNAVNGNGVESKHVAAPGLATTTGDRPAGNGVESGDVDAARAGAPGSNGGLLGGVPPVAPGSLAERK